MVVLVKTGKYKPWKISKNYNRSKNKELILNIEKHDPVALLIVKGNEIIYENYWYEYNENSLTNSFSVAKTFIGLLIGIAIDEEKIKSVDEAPLKLSAVLAVPHSMKTYKQTLDDKRQIITIYTTVPAESPEI